MRHESGFGRGFGTAFACLCLFLPYAPANAQATAQAPEGDAGTWVLTVGGDLDDEDGYRLDAGAAWFSEDTSFSLFGGRSDASADFNDFSSTSFSIGFDHSFGLVGLSADARWWGDSDVVESRALGGSLYLDNEAWRVAFRGEFRDSDFAEFDFDTFVPVRLPQGIVLVPVSGTADCGLDNTAYGLSVRRSGAAWSLTLGGTAYDYDGSDCDVRNVTVPPAVGQLPPISREVFRRIAARVLDATGRLIGTELTRENGFLESTVYAAAAFTTNELTWGADYFHDREEFAGFQSDTLIASLTMPVGNRADLELRAGVTDSDLTGSVGFAGMTLFAYFGGGR